jgi:hypothetical protein
VRRLKRWCGDSYSGAIVPELVDRLPAWVLKNNDGRDEAAEIVIPTDTYWLPPFRPARAARASLARRRHGAA